jgi:RHS repeat-associated protein
VRSVVDAATGVVAQRLEYDEYGRVLTNTNPGFQPFGYTGGLLDETTNLTRLGARDYDAETGRWTAKDPIGFAGADANLYTYAGNDPVDNADPAGLEIECKTAAACAVWNAILTQALGAAQSGDGATRAAGIRLLGVLSDLYYATEIISLTVEQGSLYNRLFDVATASAPCIDVDHWCSANSAYAARVDPTWDGIMAYDIGVNTRFVHELGHIWGDLMQCKHFRTRDNDQAAVDVEDDYRKMRGCGARGNHQGTGGACQ